MEMSPLREMRLRQDKSLFVFASEIGWSADALSKVERGVMAAGERLTAKLAQALGLEIAEAAKLCGGAHGKTTNAIGKVSHRSARHEAKRDCRKNRMPAGVDKPSRTRTSSKTMGARGAS